MSEVSENIKSEKQWLRGLLMLLFLIILEMAKIVIIAVTIIQFLFAILTGQGNENLRRFGSSLGQFAKQIVDFLSYNSEDKPFPFAEWPEPEPSTEPELEFGAAAENADASKAPEIVDQSDAESDSTAQSSSDASAEQGISDDAVDESVKDVEDAEDSASAETPESSETPDSPESPEEKPKG